MFCLNAVKAWCLSAFGKLAKLFDFDPGGQLRKVKLQRKIKLGLMLPLGALLK